MAWVTVPGSNGVWEYDNAATISDTYPDSADGANSTISGGIRTFTKPDVGGTVQVYIKTRKVGETTLRGELSKTFYDSTSGHIG
jgi:hypothetical protein